jgi:hypothetical protein
MVGVAASVIAREQLQELLAGGVGCGSNIVSALVEAVTRLVVQELLRGSAFGLLATVQAGGNVAASTTAGLLYTLTKPAVAFFYVAAWVLIALAGLAVTCRTT